MEYNYAFAKDYWGKKFFYGGMGFISFFVFTASKYKSSWKSFLPIAVIGIVSIIISYFIRRKH